VGAAQVASGHFAIHAVASNFIHIGPAWRAPLAQLLRCAVTLAVLAGPGQQRGFQPLWRRRGSCPDEPPEKLYNEGVFLLDNRRSFKAASKKFEEVERQHPYSDWAQSAHHGGLRAIRSEGL
jgi:outer membrane protein assembly factor BamD